MGYSRPIILVGTLLLGANILVDAHASFYERQQWRSARRSASSSTIYEAEILEVAFRRQTEVHTPASDEAVASLLKRKKRLGRKQKSNKKKSVPVYRKHGAISFLEPETASQPKKKLLQRIHQEQPHRIHTRVGTLAKYFKTVMRDDDIIDMPHLLQACHRFEKAMVDVQQKQSAKDLRNNIAKAEAFYKTVHHEHNMEAILALEKASDIHDYGPHKLSLLKDPSCAMGLLWIRRSLQFQYRMFQSLLQDVDATHAALSAYQHTLQAYHGWALQKVYVLAVKSSTPSNKEWLARLGGFPVDKFGAAEEEATRRDLQELLVVWKPLIQRWEQIYAELDLEDQRRV